MSKSPKTTTRPPIEIEATQLSIERLTTQIVQAEGLLREMQSANRIIRNGNHDVSDKSMSVELLTKIMRDFPTQGTTAEAEAHAAEFLHPLQSEIAQLKARLASEQAEHQAMKRLHEASNAPALLADSEAKLLAGDAEIRAADARFKALNDRLAAARMSRLANDRSRVEHEAASARALADGVDAPVLVLVEHEAIGSLEKAVGLVNDERKRLQSVQDQRRASAKRFREVIAAQKLDALMTQIQDMAETQGVKLQAVRDRLIEMVGESFLSEARAAGEARSVVELASLRPELDRLRNDNQLLKDGIVKLTAPSSAFGR
jgi:hypothetical protein